MVPGPVVDGVALDGDVLLEEPDLPPELDVSGPMPGEVLPVPELPMLDDDEPVDDPGMAELSEEVPEPMVPEAPDAPDGVSLLMAPDDAAPGVVDAPADGLVEVASLVELPAPPDDGATVCAMLIPADRDNRTAIAVCFFIVHSSTY